MGTCGANCVNCFWDFYVWLCRFWGLVTALGLWGIGVEAAYYGHYLGFVLLSFAVLHIPPLFFSDTSSCCIGVWRIILWLDDWKRAILYIVISIPCFIEPADVWMGIISGNLSVNSYNGLMLYTECKKIYVNTNTNMKVHVHFVQFDDLQDELQDDLEDNIMNPSDRQQIEYLGL
ncbi:hypothetical protein KUTeg_003707 [Tegillarca granosa]|uniref:Transmembrane protein n=1 Tax=Tegillarca granosa TaxID=220873 RepID=A0ABQ9FPI5_TEGGR|nr:hypothetical protein KUTeg_003707 [Tegillarca granosa]